MWELRVGDGEKGVGSGVHDHRVFSMLFGLCGWSWGHVRVMVVVRVRWVSLESELGSLLGMGYGY